ncbi:MAG: hypothetical protein GX027_04300 [Clostridiaceae bacterium]|jgi:hypothetical protein|nr:hypothetical protein [Clostridiaceae bacterium]
MILGMILPRENNPGGETGKVTRRILPAMSITPLYIGIKRIQLHPGISLVVCSIPYPCGCAGGHERPGRRLKRRLDRILAEEGVLSVIEHPAVKNLYGSHKARYESCLIDIAVSRFTELLGMAYRGTGLGRIEVTITGSQRCLEYAITRLVPLVKTINVLIPDGFQEPGKAEEAFDETGIPVHITTDPEVLRRTPLWIRFPNDPESFDSLPAVYHGRIVDLGALKVIDTRAKRIYDICLELPEDLLGEAGPLPDQLRYRRLPGFIAANCANAWGESAAEASIRLNMRLYLKP